MTPRENSFALISARVHNVADIPADLLPHELHGDTGAHNQILDLSMVAGALLHCWAKEAGIPPHILLADLAIGQVIENTSPTE